MGYSEKIPDGSGCNALEVAAQGSGGITIPGSAQKTWMRHCRRWFGSEHGGDGEKSDWMIPEVFSHLNNSVSLG